MVISIVGYAKSGKTALAEELVRAAIARGISVGALKTGRAGHVAGTHGGESGPAGTPLPDSSRLAAAGAAPSLFWSERGIEIAPTRDAVGPPLPGREEFAARWRRLMPESLLAQLGQCRVIVIEGRIVADAQVIQMRRRSDAAGGDDAVLKYGLRQSDIVVEGPEAIAPTVARVLDQLAERNRHRPTGG